MLTNNGTERRRRRSSSWVRAGSSEPPQSMPRVDAGLTTIGVVRQPTPHDASNVVEASPSLETPRIPSRGSLRPRTPSPSSISSSRRFPAGSATGRSRRLSPNARRTTRSIVDALTSLPAERRPLYVSVSGVAELVPDQQGLISHESTLTPQPAGFARIGLAARAVVRSSGIDAAFVHVGTVYGPGKSFTERILPALEKGRYPIFGNGENRVALVHVEDAARALVHIATLSRAATLGGQWIVVDQSMLTLGGFLTQTAAAVGGPRPRHAPRWLGRMLLGSGLIAQLSKDAPTDSSRLASTGFGFQFPQLRDGLAATLAELDHSAQSTVNHGTPRALGAGVRA